MPIRSIPAALCVFLLCIQISAQTRKGAAPPAPQNVLRAVSVYEWTGDLSKPTAARVVPVSLFIDHHFEDAGLYLSRPMPMALEPGNIYQLQTGGVNLGTLTLVQATRLHAPTPLNGFDQGWFGYGTWKPLIAPKPFVPSSTSSNAHVINSGEGRPHFSKPSDAPAATAPATQTSAPAPTAQSAPRETKDAPQADPGRPTLHHTKPGDPQRTDTQSTSSQTPASATPPTTKPTEVPAPTPTTPAPSPAPTQPAPSTPPASQSKPDDTSSTDADRPTLQPRPSAEKEKKKKANTSASVTDAGGLLGADTGRPHLHKGGTSAAAALPPLRGMPADMHQGVVVSDAADHPEHNFTYAWDDANQKAIVLAKLETIARTALPPAPVQPAAKPAHTTARTRTRKAVPPPPIELQDEELHAYEISYGGVDVFVFTAHTAEEGPARRHITLITQPDIYGKLTVLLQSVTDEAHLDQTPRMLFLDAVDADADNRAELLFELRGQTQRQFALYRIAQGTATQAFVTSGAQ